MTPAARGIFIDLLAIQWREGSIPTSVTAIAGLTNCTPDDVRAVWPMLRRHFERNGTRGRAINPKLERTRNDYDAFLDSQRRAGRRGGKASAAKRLAASSEPQGSVKQASTQQAQGSVKLAVAVAVAPKNPSAGKPPRGGWVVPFGKAWETRFQGTVAYGRIGKALEPLRTKYPDAVIIERWERFLAQAVAGKSTPEAFAQTFGDWAGSAGGLRDAYLKPGDL